MRKTGDESKKRKTGVQYQKRLENFVEETKKKQELVMKNFKIRTKEVNGIVNQVSQSFFGNRQVKKQPSAYGILIHNINKDVFDLENYELDAGMVDVKTLDGKQDKMTVFVYKEGNDIKAVEIPEKELKRIVPNAMEHEKLIDLDNVDKKSKSKK